MNRLQKTILYCAIGLGVSCSKTKLPELATDVVSHVSSTNATCGGNISNSGKATIIDRGVCWNTAGSPTINDSHTQDGIGDGAFVSEITGLVLGQTYYVRAYATNKHGTSYGNERSFVTELAVGDLYQGGVIVYLFQSGDPGYVAGQKHGLVIANTDQGSTVWSPGFTLVGSTSSGIGAGSANTNAIVAAIGGTGYAASNCQNLSLTGFNDWFLPSKDELNKVYLSRDKVSGLGSSGTYYWTSTEQDSQNSWVQDLSNGTQTPIGGGNKTISYRYRAMREF